VQWGLSNYRAVEEARNLISTGASPDKGLLIDNLAPFIINAAKGLLRASKMLLL
jgi:hypothetical protein